MVKIRFLQLHQRPPVCAVCIPWLHLYFTGIHQALPCKTVVRSAKVGTASALLRDTSWPNRLSPYLHFAYSSCRCYNGFTRWSYGGATDHAGGATVMHRNKPGLFCTLVCAMSPGCCKHFKIPGAISLVQLQIQNNKPHETIVETNLCVNSSIKKNSNNCHS